MQFGIMILHSKNFGWPFLHILYYSIIIWRCFYLVWKNKCMTWLSKVCGIWLRISLLHLGLTSELKRLPCLLVIGYGDWDQSWREKWSLNYTPYCSSTPSQSNAFTSLLAGFIKVNTFMRLTLTDLTFLGHFYYL